MMKTEQEVIKATKRDDTSKIRITRHNNDVDSVRSNNNEATKTKVERLRRLHMLVDRAHVNKQCVCHVGVSTAFVLYTIT
jgi:hypothetical protein